MDYSDDEEEGFENILRTLLPNFLRRNQPNPPKVEPMEIDSSLIRENTIVSDVTISSGIQSPFSKEKEGGGGGVEGAKKKKPSFLNSLHKRETQHKSLLGERNFLSNHFLPKKLSYAIDFRQANVFCGNFSRNGEVFVAGSQDETLRLFSYPDLNNFRSIQARDVGWSVLDTDYSPDQKFLIYSSWSPFVHLCDVQEKDTHEPLLFNSQPYHFCLFSIKFSGNSREIIGGSNEGFIYGYDLETNKVNLRVRGHARDVNTVSFSDDSPHIIFSGSDDSLCKVWDRRILHENKPVGAMVGHLEGITHISSKEDGRYFISNSKDQTIKLWDLRKMSAGNTAPPSPTRFDYRGGYGGKNGTQEKLPEDNSIMTYGGHRVQRTLIRSKISPLHSTGQKYIYSGSADGKVYVWDLLTGKILYTLSCHRSIVRDVSWHPYEPVLLSSSWDGTVGVWETKGTEE